MIRSKQIKRPTQKRQVSEKKKKTTIRVGVSPAGELCSVDVHAGAQSIISTCFIVIIDAQSLCQKQIASKK